MKWIFILLISFIFSTAVFSESCVSISSNVTRSDIPEEGDFAADEKILATVISSDYKGRAIKLKIQFVDPSPYPSYVQWLVDWWNSVVGEGEEKPADMEILFSLVDNKWKYENIKLSKYMSDNHLPPKVIDYIKQYVIANQSDAKQIITQWIKVLSKALDKKWLKALETQSDAFAKRPKYDRDNAGWGPMAYYEFVPYQDTQKDTLIIGKDTLITADYIIKQLEDEADHFRTLPEDFQSMLHKNYKGTDQRIRYLQLKKIKEIIEDYQKYHTSKIVSDWDNATTKDWILKTNPSGFRDRNAITDHLYMQRREVAQYAPMPTMCWTQNYLPEHEEDIGKKFWKATRCNVFAGDFSEQLLGLKTYPWGTKSWNANGIYNKLGGLPDFIELDWSEVWKYTNAGFPVYIVTPKNGQAGHIAIAFPIDFNKAIEIKEDGENIYNNGLVVQAGGGNGKRTISEVWIKQSDAENDKRFFKTLGKAYLYLGHLNLN